MDSQRASTQFSRPYGSGFYNLLDTGLAPPADHPDNPAAIQELINLRGGVDACFGGIGINGHLAFNEPPEPKASLSVQEFAALPTRIINLARETRTINAVTVDGELSVIPNKAITIGMKEILGSRNLRFCCNRQWHSGVVQRASHGPLTPDCPASFSRTHPDASVVLADYVTDPPAIQLR